MRLYGILSGLLLIGGAAAQQDAPLFPKPDYFRHHFGTPSSRVELRPPVRLADFVTGGKLELSLRSYLELVMANNTDIAIQRLSLEMPRNAITRAFAPFDPSLAASFLNQRAKSLTGDVIQGATTLSTLSQPANFTYSQMLESGTTYTVGFAGSKSTTNSAFATLNPALSSTLAFGVTQPLLRGRGAYVTHLPIMAARSRLRVGEYNLRDSVLRLLTTAENAYWDVINARENLVVFEKALALRAEALKRSSRELALGAMSPLDIYQPQAEYAAAEIQVSQAKFQLQQTEDALRRQIGADLNPETRRMPLLLTEPVLPPSDSAGMDREATVEAALRLRPDLRAALQQLDVDELNIKATSDLLRPDLSLSANYSATGRGGTSFLRTNVFSGTGSSSAIVSTIPGGINDALDQMFGFNFPTYSFRLSLRLPLRDRNAHANLADALVTKKLDTLRARQTEQAIRLAVLNALSQVESSKASVQLAKVARDLQQKMYEAEQKKYDLGTSIMYFVLDAQNRLTQAESRLLTESVNYRRNLLNLLRTTGELLDERGIAIQ